MDNCTFNVDLNRLWIDRWGWSLFANATSLLLVYSIPLLTGQGSFHASILGSIVWGSLGWRGWVPIIVYLALGSIVTKIGYKYKKKTGIAESRGGRRGTENVWGSASTAVIIALVSTYSNISINLLLIGFSASLASKMADTFGSEIGKRWGTKTILITSLQSALPGSEGGISLEGTLASVFGSTLITLVMSISGLISGGTVLLWVAFIGFVATLIESILGATVQKKIKFLTNEVVNSVQTLIAATLAISGALLMNLG